LSELRDCLNRWRRRGRRKELSEPGFSGL